MNKIFLASLGALASGFAYFVYQYYDINDAMTEEDHQFLDYIDHYGKSYATKDEF